MFPYRKINATNGRAEASKYGVRASSQFSQGDATVRVYNLGIDYKPLGPQSGGPSHRCPGNWLGMHHSASTSSLYPRVVSVLFAPCYMPLRVHRAEFFLCIPAILGEWMINPKYCSLPALDERGEGPTPDNPTINPASTPNLAPSPRSKSAGRDQPLINTLINP